MTLDGVNNVNAKGVLQGGGQPSTKKEESLNSIMDKALKQATAKTDFDRKVMIAKDDDGFESKYPELREFERMAEPVVIMRPKSPELRELERMAEPVVIMSEDTVFVDIEIPSIRRDTIFLGSPNAVPLDSGKDVKSEK